MRMISKLSGFLVIIVLAILTFLGTTSLNYTTLDFGQIFNDTLYGIQSACWVPNIDRNGSALDKICGGSDHDEFDHPRMVPSKQTVHDADNSLNTTGLKHIADISTAPLHETHVRDRHSRIDPGESDRPGCMRPERILAGNATMHSTPYITVVEKGRTGNQMFQYAMLFALTVHNCSWVPFLHPGMFPQLRRAFNNSLSIPFKEMELKNASYIRENAQPERIIEKFHSLPLVNTTLFGFFQSWKFSKDVASELRKQFQFKEIIKSFATTFLTDVAPQDKPGVVQVGVHVRRTSMITPTRIQMGVVPCPASYFQHAMEYFTSKYGHVQFIVASDDKLWCQENLPQRNVVYTSYSFAADLAILSLADHVITSLGTFSWWAGWLSRGQTVYYRVMAAPGTQMARQVKNDNWIPPKDEFNDWIAME